MRLYQDIHAKIDWVIQRRQYEFRGRDEPVRTRAERKMARLLRGKWLFARTLRGAEEFNKDAEPAWRRDDVELLKSCHAAEARIRCYAGHLSDGVVEAQGIVHRLLGEEDGSIRFSKTYINRVVESAWMDLNKGPAEVLPARHVPAVPVRTFDEHREVLRMIFSDPHNQPHHLIAWAFAMPKKRTLLPGGGDDLPTGCWKTSAFVECLGGIRENRLANRFLKSWESEFSRKEARSIFPQLYRIRSRLSSRPISGRWDPVARVHSWIHDSPKQTGLNSHTRRLVRYWAQMTGWNAEQIVARLGGKSHAWIERGLKDMGCAATDLSTGARNEDPLYVGFLPSREVARWASGVTKHLAIRQADELSRCMDLVTKEFRSNPTQILAFLALRCADFTARQFAIDFAHYKNDLRKLIEKVWRPIEARWEVKSSPRVGPSPLKPIRNLMWEKSAPVDADQLQAWSDEVSDRLKGQLTALSPLFAARYFGGGHAR